MLDIASLSLGAFALALLYLYTRHDKLSQIPGPPRLPIFGNVQCQFYRLHMQFTEWSRKYGDVFRIQILSQPAIVINSYDAFREAYIQRGKDFVGRPQMLRFEVIGASKGVAFRQYSGIQQQLRKRAIQALSLHGAGLQHLENLITNQLTDLVELIRKQEGQPFNPKTIIKKFLINVIMTMIFGDKCDFDNPILDDIIEFNRQGVEAATIGREDVDVWTWTSYFNPNYKLSATARKTFDSKIAPLYFRYKDTYQPGHIRGTIDMYIADERNGLLEDDVVLGCLIDYFIGGVETTATTLYGFLLVLLHSPKVQQKLQCDLDEVVGLDRQPSLSDRGLLPYAEACILELFRYQSTLPILIPRESIKDTELCGYKIPKGTWVYTNSWAIHHNEEVYPNSMSYRPERFLDEKGQLLSSDHPIRKQLVTFGLGGRRCIGEQLAKSRLFLSLCTLIQQFTFEHDEHCVPPSPDARQYRLKIIFDLEDYTLKAIPRS